MNFKINESAQKLRGGYYTPLDIAAFLTKWVFQKEDTVDILEPSLGDGIFLDAIDFVSKGRIKSVTGFEIIDDEAEKAKNRSKNLKDMKLNLHVQDFLEWSLLNIHKPQFDAAVGNPPFIRYQYMDKKLQEISEMLFKRFHLPFTKHTNLWVPFILSSLTLLRPKGRLAMVVPAELLHVMHAQSLRSYLCEECSKILIVDPEEIWFENTLQGAVLLLAEKKANVDEVFHGLSILRTSGKDFLKGDPSEYFKKATFINDKSVEGKWTKALLDKEELELLDKVEASPYVKRFRDLGSVDIGIVTGANKYFLVPDETVNEYSLHHIAFPMFGRSEHCPGIIYDMAQHNENKSKGLPTNFLWFNESDLTKYSEKVREYIAKGEEEELQTRYKCRIRTPWVNVPYVYATNLGLLKRAHDIPRLIFNEIEAYTTDTAYRISSKFLEPKTLAYTFINSLTALSAELEGRHYGGGVLELVPTEIENMLIPIPSGINVNLKDLDSKFKNNLPVDEILQIQDRIILKSIGLSVKEQNILYNAWKKLRNRRQRLKSEE